MRISALARASVLLLATSLCGCSLFRPNPLDLRRGAIVLVFDMRSAGSLKALRETLSQSDARATFFAAGQIGRGDANVLKDLRAEGHEIGLSGLKGIDPQRYSSMYGLQKYFQDEIVTQVLGAERQDLDLRYFLLQYPTKMKAEAMKLPPFLVSKGFARVVDVMPDHVAPLATDVSALRRNPVVHAYRLKTGNFDRGQVERLARRNEILVVAPSLQVLPDLIEEARAQGVPFATVSDFPAPCPREDRPDGRAPYREGQR